MNAIERRPVNLASILAASARDDPGRIAIHAEGRAWTRAQLHRAISDATRTLHDRWSVERGDRVGYLGLNRCEELVLLFALARLGAVFVPLNTRLAVTELAGIVAHAQLRVLVTDAGHQDIGSAVVDAATLRPAVADDGARDGHGVRLQQLDALSGGAERVDRMEGANEADGRPGAHRMADEEPIDDCDPATPLLLAYTSGTTGAPKGAVHSHGGLLANADASVRAHDLTEDDRVLTVLPLFHVGGLCIQTLPALLAGASLVLHPRFDAKGWLDAIATMRPTLTLMVPATLRAVIAHPAWPAANLSCLRVVMAGSSLVPRRLIDALHARDVALGQIYGSTETGPVTVALKADAAVRKAGFAGWPCFPGSVRLVDAAGADVAIGTVGEVVVRAPNVMRHYWREPAAAGFRDGWFATGDLARCDDEGCLEIMGRNRDLIISGGENVYPAEIENVLLSVRGVAEVAVVGIADEQWGEVPLAFVVRDGSTVATAADEALIRSAFEGRLARYKHPKRIVFVDRLPRNAMGKVQTHLLRERLAAEDPHA